MATVDINDTNLPDFHAEFAVMMNQIKVSAVGSDQASSVRAGGKCDQHIEMQRSGCFSGVKPLSA